MDRLQRRKKLVHESALRFKPNDRVREFAGSLSVAALVGGSGVGKEYHGTRAIAELRRRGLSEAQKNSGLVAVNSVQHFTARDPRRGELDKPRRERQYDPYFNLTIDRDFIRMIRTIRRGEALQVYPHDSGWTYGSLPPAYVQDALNIAEYTGDQSAAFAEEGFFKDFSVTCIFVRNLGTWDRKLIEREGTLPSDYEHRMIETRRSAGLVLAHPLLMHLAKISLNDFGEPAEGEAPEPPAYTVLADSYLGVNTPEFRLRQTHNRIIAHDIYTQLSERMGLDTALPQYGLVAAT